MALVHVAHGGMLAQGAEGADAAMPRTISWANAQVVIAAVKPGRDLAIVRVVLRNVGVEQVQRDAADLDAPDASPHVGDRAWAVAKHQGRAVGLGFRE